MSEAAATPAPAAAPVAEAPPAPKETAPLGAKPTMPKASDVLRRMNAAQDAASAGEATSSPSAPGAASPATSAGSEAAAETAREAAEKEADPSIRRRLERIATRAEQLRREKKAVEQERKQNAERLQRLALFEDFKSKGDRVAAIESLLGEDERDATFQEWAKRIYEGIKPATPEEKAKSEKEAFEKRIAEEFERREKAAQEAAAKAEAEKVEAGKKAYWGTTAQAMHLEPDRWPRVAAALATGQWQGQEFSQRDILSYVERHWQATKDASGTGRRPDPDEVLDAFEVHFGGSKKSKEGSAGQQAAHTARQVEGQKAGSAFGGSISSDMAADATPRARAGSDAAPPNETPAQRLARLNRESLIEAKRKAGLLK